MGVSPYYKGADCNFWALYDNNFDHVGSTVHLLNKNLDGGPILYNAVSEFYPNPFIYSMSTTKSVINSLLYYISNKKIHKNFKIFKILNFEEFLIIKQKFIKSDELVVEKQLYSLIILAIWFEKNY